MKKKEAKALPTFQEVYLPLEYHYGKTFCNNHMAFDFPMKMLYANALILNPDQQQQIVKVINNVGFIPTINLPTILTYRDGIIFAYDHDDNEREFIILRGWGHLTGVGGLALKGTDAAKIQDDFAEYIINTLTTYFNV